jgi:hypothetical protein
MTETKPPQAKKPGWWKRFGNGLLELVALVVYKGPR